MEMIVAIFVFSLIMTTTMATFVGMTSSRKKVKAIQLDVEDARYAIELMAKTLRTSSVISPNALDVQDIRAYNYSEGMCVEYKFNSTTNKLQSWSGAPNTEGEMSTCSWPASTSLNDMTNGNIGDVHFAIVKTGTTTVGKVIIAVKVCYGNDCTAAGDVTTIQTAVSLRDYNEVTP